MLKLSTKYLFSKVFNEFNIGLNLYTGFPNRIFTTVGKVKTFLCSDKTPLFRNLAAEKRHE